MADKGLVEMFVEKFGGIREYWGYQVERVVCMRMSELGYGGGRQTGAGKVWML